MKGRMYKIFENVSIETAVMETKKGPVEYYYNGAGRQDAAVVMCSHGGIGGADQARILLDWIDHEKYSVLCPSRPGYLLTPLESGRQIEEQADLFAALLDDMGIRKVCMVSASAGGPIAYAFAEKYPERLWGLVSIDSVSGYYDMPETAGPISTMLFTSNVGQKLLKFIGDMKPEWFLNELFKSESYFTKKQIKEYVDFVMKKPELVEFMKAFILSMNPYNERKIGTENDMELYKRLTHMPVEKIKIPALIIHGTHDADVKFYDGVYAYEHIEGAKRFWIEEGSHLGFWLSKNYEKAQQYARQFIDDAYLKLTE